MIGGVYEDVAEADQSAASKSFLPELVLMSLINTITPTLFFFSFSTNSPSPSPPPCSSQYGWRGSEVSVGECVLDSGKASDLSVCSWPVEPIHWTPFPLLQQLASHSRRTPTVSGAGK